jgi:hypothetical protein
MAIATPQAALASATPHDGLAHKINRKNDMVPVRRIDRFSLHDRLNATGPVTLNRREAIMAF